MSERKVLNKYYPPDFDASKLPRVKREKNRQFTIRLMAPFNMRCTTCGEYIYRGKKFNARKEDVIGKLYLGIQIYRFYIKCTKCLAEITFVTDPESQDYAMENGAIRNFESVRLAEKQAEHEEKQKKEEEANNPMKLLENRTKDSRREMAILETLEDLREMNMKNANFDPLAVIKEKEEYERQLQRLQEEEDEKEIERIFGKRKNGENSIVEEETIVIKKSRSGEENDVAEVKEEKVDLNVMKKESENGLGNNVAKAASKITKTNVASFIKKKDAIVVVKLEPVEVEATKANETAKSQQATISKPLLSIAYSDSDESDEN